MEALKEGFPCKILSVFLCLLMAVEVQIVFSQQETPLARFAIARQAFAEGDYRAARSNLELIIRQVDEARPENRGFLGSVYTILGASTEMLKEPEPARAYYRRAAELLGGQRPAIGEVNRLPLPLLEQAFGVVQPTPEPGLDPVARFDNAERAYRAGNYSEAKTILDLLITELGGMTGQESLKGQTFLLAGATYENLNLKSTAVGYYCQAKAILGEGRTFTGLDLATLRWYDERCPQPAVAVAGAPTSARTRRGSESMSRVLKVLLIATGVGILIWYLGFSKNSPFKKKVKEGEYSSACFTTFWSFSYSATYAAGPGGMVSISPNPEQVYPKPSESNGWEDQVTYTVTATNPGDLLVFWFKSDIEIGGGDNQKRHDIVSVDGSAVLDVTNQFSESCSSPGKTKYDNVFVMTSPGTITVKHKVEITTSSAVGTSARLTKR